MRIALVHPFSWPKVRRGGERYAHDLAWWLASEGHEVDFVTGGDRDSVSEFEGARMVYRAPQSLRYADRRGLTGLDGFGRTVLPWLESQRYDVVQALTPSGAIAASKAKQRVVYSVIGHPGPLRKDIRRADRKVWERACKAANVVTTLSKSAADEATAMTGVAARVVTPGLRIAAFPVNLRPRTGTPTLLFAADVTDHRKRLSVILDAMPMVLKSVPKARLVIGGPGQLPDDIDPAVRAAMDTPGVGSFEDLVQLYRQAHVTVLPSVDEAFGLVLVESLACGTPVVGSDSGGIPEIVTRDVGALAEADNPAAFAVAVIETLALAEQAATPTVCADHATRWGWDVVGPTHLAAYDAAMRG